MNEKENRFMTFFYKLMQAKHILKKHKLIITIMTCLFVSACATMSTFQGSNTGANPSFLPVAQSAALGNGNYKVALLLPSTAPGQGAIIAQSLRNAVEMALVDIRQHNLEVIPYDTKGTADGAALASREAIAQGAKLIIGPVFSPSVKAVRQVVATTNTPAIAFSTDRTAAGGNVFLLSFLPKQSISRIIAYAAEQENKSIAALIPQNSFGSLAEAALQETVPQVNARVTSIASYQGTSSEIRGAFGEIGASVTGAAPSANALLLPDNAQAAAIIASQFKDFDIHTDKVKVLGSGQWYDPAIWSIPALNGAWFAAPDPNAWSKFRAEYKTRYGTDPSRVATLSYDATSLVAALEQVTNGNITATQLTSSTGFNGVDGLFRFLPNGENQRGLAVLEITNGSATVIDNAPSSFSSSIF